MRKVVSTLFISLDGVVEAPDRWQSTWGDESAAALARALDTSDTVLLGRSTYEMWAGYWPGYDGTDDAAFADWINKAPKYVVSRTLDDVGEWPNSHLVKGDLAAAVGRLKEADGKDIAVAGSPGLVASLLERDLLDELALMINPVVAGGGLRRLFPGDATMKRLELVRAEPTSTGVILATYRRPQN
ncbi:dihydrofolate reductase family protein [Spirillospora sp. NPDC029432]|uniref:dihydrofolate reductase family protein n=1 Tax=Spirillospora sp. NPDC029432 TaxID=3154599 RepID=UPI00345439FA